MKPIVIVAVGSGVAGVVAAGIWGRGLFPLASGKSRPAEAPLVAEVRSLRADLEKLQAREPRQMVLSQPDPVATISIAQAAPGTESAEETTEMKLERIERHAQATAESLDRRLLTEPRDVQWANDSLGKAGQTLAANLPGASVLESTCASTVCRIVLSQQSEEDMQRLGPALSEAPPFDQGTFYRYDLESTPPKATLYVIRRGHNLQQLTGSDTAHLAQ
ncbi:MAG TPA: hypothetical protein VJN18_03655 [Polyangiaceae bacterium]|nr:hypothetical protein [Polyangiaceae bacterium]